MARIKRHMRAVEVATGALLVAVGLTMLTGAFSRCPLAARNVSGAGDDRLIRPPAEMESGIRGWWRIHSC